MEKANTSTSEIEEIQDEIDISFKQFKNFDIVSNPPLDHHFLWKKPSQRTSLLEKIVREWKMLDTDLPNSILIRAYESRMDLMRAVIIGPPGTPYHHGLFFFDILFPSKYQNRPPKLFYHSQGLDLNSNLRSDGKVNLSLLDTWSLRAICGWFEHNDEKWNPNQSCLLQVLVSIWSLVLNSKPYLNESVRLYAVNEAEVLKYNKTAFMLTCEGMIRMLQEPLWHFEDFVAGHFRNRAHQILMNYREYLDKSESMISLFLKLVNVFEANGTHCQHHLCQVKIEMETTEERSTKNGIGTTVLGKLKHLMII